MPPSGGCSRSRRRAKKRVAHAKAKLSIDGSGPPAKLNNKVEPGAIREAIEVGRHTGRAQTDYHEQMDGAPVTASEFREQLSRVVPLRGKGRRPQRPTGL